MESLSDLDFVKAFFTSLYRPHAASVSPQELFQGLSAVPPQAIIHSNTGLDTVAFPPSTQYQPFEGIIYSHILGLPDLDQSSSSSLIDTLDGTPSVFALPPTTSYLLDAPTGPQYAQDDHALISVYGTHGDTEEGEKDVGNVDEGLADEEEVAGRDGESEAEEEYDEEGSEYEVCDSRGKRKRCANRFKPRACTRSRRSCPAVSASPPSTSPQNTCTAKRSAASSHSAFTVKTVYMCPYLRRRPGQPDERCAGITTKLYEMRRHVHRHITDEWDLLEAGTPAEELFFGGYPPDKTDDGTPQADMVERTKCEGCQHNYSRPDALKRHISNKLKEGLPCQPGKATKRKSSTRQPKKRARVESAQFVELPEEARYACKVDVLVGGIPGFTKPMVTKVVKVHRDEPLYSDRFRVEWAGWGYIVEVLPEGKQGGRKTFTPFVEETDAEDDA